MSTRGQTNNIGPGGGAPGPIAIAGNVTVYSQSFKLYYGQAFGIALKAASSGTVALQIQLEQSNVLPTTEGASDTQWVVGDGIADIIAAYANTTKRIIAVLPVPMTYGRLKIIGGPSNDASTTLDANVFIQELVA